MLISNPIVPGWYADPEARVYGGKYYIYVTRSITDYDEQLNIDCFSSPDLLHWEKHEGIIDVGQFPEIRRAVWAPSVVERGGKYYLVFAANDIKTDDMPGGLLLAVSDSPVGPFTRHVGGSLVGRFVNGAQPIDAHFFKDDDGLVYLCYGGWHHCNIALMNQAMTGFVPLADGEIFREITPPGYTEAPCMLRQGSDLFFMWSSGSWKNGTYGVSFCRADGPFGPFASASPLLESRPPVGEGPGHNGWLRLPDGSLALVYHRRPVGDSEPGHRCLCIDRLTAADGRLLPVAMTSYWEL